MKIIVLLLLAAAFNLPAAVRNIKLLTDNMPDYTDLNSIAHSMTDAFSTEEQKAIAIWKWTSNQRFQVSTVRDSLSAAVVPGSHPTYGCIYSDVKLGNNFANAFCVPTDGVLLRLWKVLGKTGTVYDINGHTVTDLNFGGTPHNFDASMGFYYRDSQDRHILSCDEIMTRRMSMSNMMSDVTNINVFQIGKGNASIYEGKSVDFILQDPSNAEYSSIGGSRTTDFTETYGDKDPYAYLFHIKPYESYTKRSTQVSTTDSKYFLATAINQSGANVNLAPPSVKPYAIQSNGIWAFKPDLANAKALEAFSVKTNVAQGGTPTLHPAAAGQNAVLVYRVDAANVICHAIVTGSYVRGASDLFTIEFSADSSNWFNIYTAAGTGTQSFSAEYGTQGTTLLARTRYSYFLKFTLQGATTSSAGLNGMTVTTYTVLNQRTLPRLTLGSNRIKFVGGGTFEPLEIAYYWTEFEKSALTVTTKKRTHLQSISQATTEYYLNTAGSRIPILDSVRLGWPGTGPALTAGYGDGNDVGAAYEFPKYFYDFGRNIAIRKPVSSAPAPFSGADSLITDNAGGPTASSALWNSTMNPAITIDLGSAQNVAGIRLGEKVGTGAQDYLDSAQIFTSTDNVAFTLRGKLAYRELWDPPTNYLYQNIWDAPPTVNLRNGGILYFKFNGIFTGGAVSARYVKVKVFNSVFAVQVSEIEIYNTMARTLINNEVDHKFALSDKGYELGIALGVEGKNRLSPAGPVQLAATPNPLTSSALISLSGDAAFLSSPDKSLKIYDALGRVVADLTRQLGGGHEVEWRAAKMPAGRYLARFAFKGREAVELLFLVK